MKIVFTLIGVGLVLLSNNIYGQTKQDSIEIKQVALDYIESQHKPNPLQMQGALHPRMVKRTFWKDKATNKEYLREATAESIVLLAESYNKNGDKFPATPKKDVKFLDVSQKVASVKLTADDWIDYMHIVKLNGKWQIVNVLWEFNDITQH